MAIKVINRKYSNQFYPEATTTDWIIGNVGDWQRLVVTFEAAVNFRATNQDSISIDYGTSTITLNNGKAWSDYGFNIGDAIVMTYDILGDGNGDGIYDSVIPATLNFNIINLYGSTMETDLPLFSASFTIMPIEKGNIKVSNVDIRTNKEPEGIKFDYTLLSNDNFDNTNLNSFIDGTTTQFSLSNLNSLTVGVFADMSADGFQSGMAIEKARVKKVSGDGTKALPWTYEISVDFMLTSFFDDLNDIADRVKPSVVFDANSLTDNFHIKAFPKWNNPNILIQNDLNDTKVKGNSGWFDENLNGLNNNFTIDSVKYFTEAGLEVDKLDYATPIVLEARISGISNLSEDSKFGLGFLWVPQNEDDYKDKTTNFYQNLFINSLGEYENGSISLEQNTGSTVYPGGDFGSGDIGIKATDDIFFTSVDIDTALVRATFIPSAGFSEFFDARNENDRNYALWVSVANHDLGINFTDRVSLLLDYNQLIKTVPPAGPYDGMTNKFIEHPQSENVEGVLKYEGFVEDDVLSRVIFSVNKQDDVLIRNMSFGYEVENIGTEETYVLENYIANLTQFPKDVDDVQQIAFDEIRGFKYNLGNNKNFAKLERYEVNDSGDDLGYVAYFGTKIRWEDWLSRDDVPEEYFNLSLENNGYNNDWIDYLRSGDQNTHRINFFVLTEVQEGDELKIYKNVFELTFNDYDENMNITKTHNYFKDSDNSSLDIGTDPETGDPLGAILNNEPTRIEITYENLVEDFDFTKIYATITIEIDKGAGEFEHRQLSSVWDSESDNPLVPITGENNLKIEMVASNIAKTICLVDPTKLTGAIKYKITGRIGCWPEGDVQPELPEGIYAPQYEYQYE